ncbi:alpha/beta fold hydrolase [Pandoraea nosoerga]|uniref:Alpha/beta hydrolase n=1 Tax=Pandoraea nosoerga TaxID=2508296 RepID=A0A5E4W067_9BURK|nr:alpha/beta hydrolase [Pandoraea nosoerga]VVE18022.1 alpha/beta hydrolase [Pandoraea nosoerga]
MTIGHTRLGDGPEGVIVCHGWFGDGVSTFSGMFPYLDAKAYTYAFVDFRGFGKSVEMKGDCTMEEIARDVLDLADSFGWKRFHLIGHSMGGKAVQRVMVDARERVKSLIAIAPVPASGVPFEPAIWELFSGCVNDDTLRRAIVDFSTSNRLTPTWGATMIDVLRRTSDSEAFGKYLLPWAKHDFSALAQGIEVPVKVVIGEYDPSLTRDVMEQTFLSLYPNAELEVIANAGHYPAHETPVMLATVIERFLANHA